VLLGCKVFVVLARLAWAGLVVVYVGEADDSCVKERPVVDAMCCGREVNTCPTNGLPAFDLFMASAC
jgi:hypothetical protein